MSEQRGGRRRRREEEEKEKEKEKEKEEEEEEEEEGKEEAGEPPKVRTTHKDVRKICLHIPKQYLQLPTLNFQRQILNIIKVHICSLI